MFGRYHVNEPRRFYDASAKWLVSPDPGSGQVTDLETTIGGSSSASANAQPQAASSSGKRIDPYYLYLKLPDATSEHFIAIEPFVPVSSGNSINRLASFLTANSDPGHYGELESFEMPQGSSALGPVQVATRSTARARSRSRSRCSGAGTRASSRGASSSSRSAIRSSTCGRSTCAAPAPARIRSSSSSRCSPTARARCVTRPSTARSTRSSSARRRRRRVARSAAATPPTTTRAAPRPRPSPSGSTTTTSPATTGSVQDLLNQAADDFNQAQTALAQTDLATYQRLVNQGRR